MPKVDLLVGGETVRVELESARSCEGCEWWTKGLCTLLDVVLPPWRGPIRPAECFEAQAKKERAG